MADSVVAKAALQILHMVMVAQVDAKVNKVGINALCILFMAG
jgi:hypothetical protein